MAVSITRLSWWLWGGKDEQTLPSGSSLNNSTSDFGLGLRDVDTVKFASVKGGKVHSAPPRRSKPKWNSWEERKIDREYDVVLVPSDGGCLSGSDSDDSDWSMVGWSPMLLIFRVMTKPRVALLCLCRAMGAVGGRPWRIRITAFSVRSGPCQWVLC